jgi:hypothetical protein
MSRVAFSALLVSLLAAPVRLASAGQFDGWSTGRASYYGLDGGATIHQG